MNSVDNKFPEAMDFLVELAKQEKIPITRADIMIIKNLYLPGELERYKLSEADKYWALAARFALMDFCKDYGLENHVRDCQVMDQ